MSFAIIAIGNPGVGKSTILNSIAGEVLFKSGTSYGSGLTYQLDEKKNAKGKFIDTPGLADDKYRKAAGEAISAVLKRGGSYKILFFVTEYSGRVVQQDVATMRLVLDAAPEIGTKYGIIINQVSKKVMQGIQSNNDNAAAFAMSLFGGLADSMRCPQTNIIMLSRRQDLDAEDNKFLDLEDLEDGKFKQFIYNNVPVIKLTRNRAKDIKINNFDDMVQAIESLHQEMARNKAHFKKETDKLMAQLHQAAADKAVAEQRERAGAQDKHKEGMAALGRDMANIQQALVKANSGGEQRQLKAEIAKLQQEAQQREFQLKMQLVEAQNANRDRAHGPPEMNPMQPLAMIGLGLAQNFVRAQAGPLLPILQGLGQGL